MTPGPGRPKFHPQNRHSETIQVMLRPEDRDRLAAMAAKRRLYVSTYAREALLRQLALDEAEDA